MSPSKEPPAAEPPALEREIRQEILNNIPKWKHTVFNIPLRHLNAQEWTEQLRLAQAKDNFLEGKPIAVDSLNGNNASANKVRMDGTEIAAVIIGLGFLALVGFMFVYTLQNMKTVNDFLIVWSAVGPIVGVVIGSMPAYFFRSMAKAADDRAYQMAKDMAHMGSDGKVPPSLTLSACPSDP